MAASYAKDRRILNVYAKWGFKLVIILKKKSQMENGNSCSVRFYEYHYGYT